MVEAVSEERWAGARALCEGQAPTHTRIAAVLGVHVTTVSHRAAEHGWKGLDFRRKRVSDAHVALIDLAARAAAGLPIDDDLLPARPRGEEPDYIDIEIAASTPEPMIELIDENEDPEARIERIGDMIAVQADRLLRRATASGSTPDRHQIASLIALTQLAERIATQSRARAAKRAVKSDEELAEILQKVHDRIRYLSKAVALQFLRKRGVSEDELKELAAEVEELERISEASFGA